MRDTTAAWLEPMFVEAQARDINLLELMQQAMMPAAEAATPFMDWLVRNVPEGATSRAVDWIRVGQLLREKLGWLNYPANPS